jgi:hypothetical protein
MKLLAKLVLGFVAFCAASAASALVVRKKNPEFGDEPDSRFSLVAAMDGREFASSAAPLTEASALAYMGGIELDLSGASLEGGARLRLVAVMGGINVTVPPEWRVEVSTDEMAGGVANRTNPDEPSDGPLLVVHARAIMGGIQILHPEPA